MPSIKPSIKLSMSFGAQGVAQLLRETLEELGYEFERARAEKHYTQIMVVLPLPKFAYVFRFIVSSPVEFVLDLYDAKLTHSGMMHYLEIDELNVDNIDGVRRLLLKLIEKLPRKPWKFTIGQRLDSGILTMDILRARKRWEHIVGSEAPNHKYQIWNLCTPNF